MGLSLKEQEGASSQAKLRKEQKRGNTLRCDADPSALANYVVALVKKDKPEKELKAFCADQLDVFLQKETSGFVDKLFESLYTKSYLPSLEPPKVEAKPAGQEKEEVKEELPLKQNFQESVEEERESRKKKYSSPQRSRGDSSEQRTREKKRDDGKWRDYDRYYDRSDLYREKSSWRRGRSKSRSKSRGLSRSRSRSRGRSKDREAARSAEHRERSKFKSERNDVEGSYNPVSMSPSKSTEQYSSAQSVPSAVTVIAPAHHLENTTESWSNFYNNHSNPTSFGRNPPPKRRCRDYDGPPLTQSSLINNRDQPGTSAVPSLAPVGARLPPPLPQNLLYTVSEHTYEPDGYNPEAPSITSAGRSQYRQFFTRAQTQRPNLIGLTSGEMDTNPRGFAVAFQNDPEAALIQYLTNDEARKAISSTEAVLNNRFIRVLWHREGEQQPPPQQPQPSPQALHHQLHLQQQALATAPAVTMHSSLSKVMNKPPASGAYVLNKVPVKRRLGAAGGNQPDLSQSGAAVEDSQEAMKLQQDMRKKKQEMLEKQIECQKMLISKLEKNKAMKPEERAEIMKTLKELAGKISQLKDELKTSSATSTPSKLKSKTEAQKELLDAELDFHKRLSSGEDTTELRKKLNQLQVEKFGDIEDLQEEDSPLSVVLTFKSRSEAENAANQGSRFKDRRLQISWYKPKVPSVSTEIEEEESKEEETETSDLFLHEDDDDDDEDEDESRSWRR
ncbi:rna-binding protein 27 [Limosa lapponica baueri]|uniref:Rna-binding protein 27 n=1 Tax=Limosa lapponica baueri TaxID=1758121 RepID=A0A2I0TQU4_LIMLA|nr:rna-binding protein 27 [Limosa lapponica baueri]